MDKELKIKKMCKTILDSEIGEDIRCKIDCIGVDCAKDNCPFRYIRETCPNRIDAITTFKMKDISKIYLKKEYLGWELLKEVSEGNFEVGEEFVLVENPTIEYKVGQNSSGDYILTELNGSPVLNTTHFTNNSKFVKVVEKAVDFNEVLKHGRYVKLTKQASEILRASKNRIIIDDTIADAVIKTLSRESYLPLGTVLLAISWIYEECSNELINILNGKNFVIKE